MEEFHFSEAGLARLCVSLNPILRSRWGDVWPEVAGCPQLGENVCAFETYVKRTVLYAKSPSCFRHRCAR